MNQIPDIGATATVSPPWPARSRWSVTLVLAMLVSGWVVVPAGASSQEAPSEPIEAESADTAVDGEAAGLLVTYRDGTSEFARAVTVAIADGLTSEDLSRGRDLDATTEVLDVPSPIPASEAKELADIVAELPFVEIAEPNYIVTVAPPDGADVGPDVTQTLPSGGVLWGLDRIDQRSASYDGKYNYDETGSGVRAYIFDTGIYASHLEFGARVVSGFDAIGSGTGTNDCPIEPPHYGSHGTHVAGTVGGSRSGSIDWRNVGVAKAVTLVPIRVLGCSGTGSYDGIITAINWVIADHQSRTPRTPGVANFSLGGPKSTALNNKIQELIDAGITTVVSAGNDNTDACAVSPASAPSAITVGASDIDDTRASFSNYGVCNDIYAPGVDIVSAWYGGASQYAYASGTSMAAPHVTGVVARMLSADPSLTPAQVWARLQAIATPFVSGQAGDANKLLFAPSSLGAPTVTWSNPGALVATRSVAFSATFSRSVAGLAADDIAVGGTASGCSPSVSGSGVSWTVTVTCSTDGSVTATLAANAVADSAGITGPLASTATSTVTIDATAPTAALTTSAITSTSRTLEYTLTTSEPVLGLTTADFSTTGSTATCSLAITGSASPWTVTATCTTDGTVALSLNANSLTDLAGNLGPTTAATASTVTIDATAPTAALTTSAITSTSRTLEYTLTTSEPVLGLTTADFSTTGSTATCSLAIVGSTSPYTVTATCTTDGTVALSLNANSLTDLAGNAGPPAKVAASTVTINTAPPTTVPPADPAPPAASDRTPTDPAPPASTPSASLLVPGLTSTTRTVVVQLVLSDPIGVSTDNFVNTGTAKNCTFAPVGSGTSWTVVASCATDGTLIVRFDSPAVAPAVALPVAITSSAPASVTTNKPRVSAKALARLANVSIPARSRISVAVSRTTSRNCRVVGSRIVRTGTAACAITLRVNPPRGRNFKKTIVLSRAS